MVPTPEAGNRDASTAAVDMGLGPQRPADRLAVQITIARGDHHQPGNPFFRPSSCCSPGHRRSHRRRRPIRPPSRSDRPRRSPRGLAFRNHGQPHHATCDHSSDDGRDRRSGDGSHHRRNERPLLRTHRRRAITTWKITLFARLAIRSNSAR